MNSLLAALAASIATFAATNVDDLLLLTLFFAQRVPTRRIVLGQYIGFAAIVVVSLIGVWAALAVPHRWIRALGLVPLTIGIKQLLQIRRTAPKQLRPNNYGVASVALVTLSNGADNVGVYVPFFLISRSYLWLIMIAYAVLIAIWCFVGRWLGNHLLVLRLVDRWGHWAVPLVFIGLGTYIFSS